MIAKEGYGTVKASMKKDFSGAGCGCEGEEDGWVMRSMRQRIKASQLATGTALTGIKVRDMGLQRRREGFVLRQEGSLLRPQGDRSRGGLMLRQRASSAARREGRMLQQQCSTQREEGRCLLRQEEHKLRRRAMQREDRGGVKSGG